jgi:hypothetical protein
MGVSILDLEGVVGMGEGVLEEEAVVVYRNEQGSEQTTEWWWG